MLREFLPLLTICVLVVALPQNRRLVTSGESTRAEDGTSTTTHPSITSKPQWRETVNITTADDLKTRVSEAGDRLVVVFVVESDTPGSLTSLPTVQDIAATVENVAVLKVDKSALDCDQLFLEDWGYGVLDSKVPSFILIKNGKKIDVDVTPSRLRGTVAEYVTSSNSSSNNH